MNARVFVTTPREEIACLAYLNWEKDGCPSERELDYWLEAEHQINATKHLLLLELVPDSRAQPNAVDRPWKKRKTMRHRRED